jgi:hypothetical protein
MRVSDFAQSRSLTLPPLYRNHHIIGDREFQVSITENEQGLLITAEDPVSEKVLHCPLYRQSKIRSNEDMDRQVSDIIRRLRIEQLFGEEALLLSS